MGCTSTRRTAPECSVDVCATEIGGQRLVAQFLLKAGLRHHQSAKEKIMAWRTLFAVARFGGAAAPHRHAMIFASRRTGAVAYATGFDEWSILIYGPGCSRCAGPRCRGLPSAGKIDAEMLELIAHTGDALAAIEAKTMQAVAPLPGDRAVVVDDNVMVQIVVYSADQQAAAATLTSAAAIRLGNQLVAAGVRRL